MKEKDDDDVNLEINFGRHLGPNKCYKIIEKGSVGAYTDSEESETYTIYMHYSDNFDWWGIAEQKQRELSARSAQLMHAFLGRQRDEWYIVPDKDVNNLNLGKQIRKTDHYKVEINHGNPSNQTLLKHYSIYEGAQS